MNDNNVFSIQTHSDQKIQWGNLNRNHDDDITISKLISEAVYKKFETLTLSIKFNDIIIIEFNKFLKNNNLPTYINIDNINKNEKNEKKLKKNKISNKDKIKLEIEQNSIKKKFIDFLNYIKIEYNFPTIKANPLECFFNIIYWTIYLLNNQFSIPIKIMYDNAISLSRMTTEYEPYIDSHIFKENLNLIKKIENIIKIKEDNYRMKLINLYPELIYASYWDKNKPNSIKLFKEQKQMLDTVMEHIINNKSLLLFYWVPPANGKTLICTILVKLVSKYNLDTKKNIEEENRKNKKNNENTDIIKFQKKSILYICYNDIVRNSVSQLCTTHDVDIKFWFANYHKDMFKDYHIVDFRPYKNCFPDWRKISSSKKLQKRDKKNEDKLFSPNVKEQWNEYLERTRLNNDRENGELTIDELENADNIPEMVIADLMSAEIILKEFPDLFIPYFDEAFAASNEMINAKIMSILPKVSILVSATLSYPEEIPNTIQNFKIRHSIENNDFISLIKNDIQLINCDFIGPEGEIISPHHLVNNIGELNIFIQQLKKYPIIQRGYSNKIVNEMYSKIENILPSELKIKKKFPSLGHFSNSNLREYGMELIEFISNSNNQEYFNMINKISIKVIQNNTIENMITHNSFYYYDKNTLHVSNRNDFMNYVNEISNELLEGSPKLKNIISKYEKQKEEITKKLEIFEKNNRDEKHYVDIKDCEVELSNLKIQYSEEFIWNSYSFLKKFNNHNKIDTYNKPLIDMDVIKKLDDLSAKLFLSHIGVYNQSNMNLYEMDTFLAYKDIFKFIMSDPSIIFGTNINITLIDINENMSSIMTRNKMYQMIGRAGRIGKSSSASVIFRSWDLFRIIIHEDDINIEAQQIEENIKKII